MQIVPSRLNSVTMQKLRYGLIFLFMIFDLLAQGQVAVSGKIIDAESKEPLNSASVYCQNTTIGTTTNKQGEFSLQLKSGGYELIISYTGYQKKRVQISS